MAEETLIAAWEPLPALAVLEERWRAVEEEASLCFFNRWSWIGSWLRATGARPELLAVRDGSGAEVALALFGLAREARLLGRVTTLRLNEAGDAAADRAFVEYNAPLCRAGQEAAATRAIAAALMARRDWRALRLSGVEPSAPLLAALTVRRRVLVDRSPSYRVDLARVRDAGGDYLSLLSANMRAQIRRSAKDYPGKVTVTSPPDDATERAWLADMRTLNAGRHEDNAWEEPLFRAFVAELVARPGVDLIRVAAGDMLLGYLLNFRSGGRAMNYQSAFAPPLNAKSKPGLMAHVAAVQHYAGAGLTQYSLLAGKDRYKESLSTGAETLEWWSLERFSPALEAEYWLRRLLRR